MWVESNLGKTGKTGTCGSGGTRTPTSNLPNFDANVNPHLRLRVLEFEGRDSAEPNAKLIRAALSLNPRRFPLVLLNGYVLPTDVAPLLAYMKAGGCVLLLNSVPVSGWACRADKPFGARPCAPRPTAFHTESHWITPCHVRITGTLITGEAGSTSRGSPHCCTRRRASS